MINGDDLIALLGKYSKNDITAICLQTKIKDFKFDSLTTLEVIYEIEQCFNLSIDETSIPPEAFSEFSIEELARFLGDLKTNE